MTKYKKLITLVRSWIPTRQHFEIAMLQLSIIGIRIKSWLPGPKDIFKAILFAGLIVSAGFFFTIGAQLADRPVHITLEIAE